MRNGIWDRKLKPNLKINIIVSSIAAVLAGIIWFAKNRLDGVIKKS